MGKVAEIKDDTVTMTRYAVVNACVDFRDIRQVFVVTNNMDVVADEENANMKAARRERNRNKKKLTTERLQVRVLSLMKKMKIQEVQVKK